MLKIKPYTPSTYGDAPSNLHLSVSSPATLPPPISLAFSQLHEQPKHILTPASCTFPLFPNIAFIIPSVSSVLCLNKYRSLDRLPRLTLLKYHTDLYPLCFYNTTFFSLHLLLLFIVNFIFTYLCLLSVFLIRM